MTEPKENFKSVIDYLSQDESFTRKEKYGGLMHNPHWRTAYKADIKHISTVDNPDGTVTINYKSTILSPAIKSGMWVKKPEVTDRSIDLLSWHYSHGFRGASPRTSVRIYDEVSTLRMKDLLEDQVDYKDHDKYKNLYDKVSDDKNFLVEIPCEQSVTLNFDKKRLRSDNMFSRVSTKCVMPMYPQGMTSGIGKYVDSDKNYKIDALRKEMPPGCDTDLDEVDAEYQASQSAKKLGAKKLRDETYCRREIKRDTKPDILARMKKIGLKPDKKELKKNLQVEYCNALSKGRAALDNTSVNKDDLKQMCNELGVKFRASDTKDALVMKCGSAKYDALMDTYQKGVDQFAMMNNTVRCTDDSNTVFSWSKRTGISNNAYLSLWDSMKTIEKAKRNIFIRDGLDPQWKVFKIVNAGKNRYKDELEMVVPMELDVTAEQSDLNPPHLIFMENTDKMANPNQPITFTLNGKEIRGKAEDLRDEIREKISEIRDVM